MPDDVLNTPASTVLVGQTADGLAVDAVPGARSGERGIDAASAATTGAPGPDGRTAGGTQLFLLVAASCLSVLGAVLIAPVLPDMTKAFAGTPGVSALVPLSLTAPALMIGLISPFAGIIVDRIDRKRLLLIAMVAYSIFGTAPLYLPSLGGIVASRVGVGICEAAIMTCATTLIGDYWTGAKRARYLGLQTLVAALGATVFLAVGGALGSAGWRTPFWLYLVALVLVVPMARGLWQPTATERASGTRRLPPVPWKLLGAPLVTTFFGGIMFYALIVHLSYVLDGVGFTSTAAIGGIAAVMSLATAAGAIVFGRVSHRTPRSLVPLEFGLAAVGLLVVFATSAVPLITIGAVLTGFGTGALLPTLLTWSVNRLSFEQRGRGTGLFTGVLFIGQFLCPVIVLAIKGDHTSYQPALGVLGAASAVVAVVTAIALRRNTQALNDTRA